MKPVRRWMGAMVLAALLLSGVASAAPTASAAGPATVDAATSRAELCARLAQYIERLQALPPGPLRNALLRIALSLQAQYCA